MRTTDILRTFPENIHFACQADSVHQGGGVNTTTATKTTTTTELPPLVRGMRNVLMAYSVHDRAVGYCQSLNYIVGMLLLLMHGEEEHVFWALCTLLQCTLPRDMYSDCGGDDDGDDDAANHQLLGAKIDQEVLWSLVAEKHPVGDGGDGGCGDSVDAYSLR